MPNLVNSAAGHLFTIPTTDWTAINRRVGVALSEEKIADFISKTIPSFPALLTSSKLWKQSTFADLIAQSNALSAYTDEAIKNFTELNTKVKAISGNTVPADIQEQTKTALQSLATKTTPMASSFAGLYTAVHTFLNDNQAVDAQMADHKDQFGSFWKPLGEVITAVEDAAGKVTGTWQSMSDDLNNALSKPIDVTMPFIESLNIEAAIISWKNLKGEATAFPSMAKDQEQYWTNPLETINTLSNETDY